MSKKLKTILSAALIIVMILSSSNFEHLSHAGGTKDIKDFNLGDKVVANYNSSKKIITISGSGEIIIENWVNLARKFSEDAYKLGTPNAWLNTNGLSIEFLGKEIQFPITTAFANYPYENGFFQNFKGEIKGLENIDTSNVKFMHRMFKNTEKANPNLENWDVSNVVYMKSMFDGAKSANPNVKNWDTSQVQNMEYMFRGCKNANPDVRNWNVSRVSYMTSMFEGAENANPDVKNWDVSNVENMNNMFAGALNANPDTSNWNTVKLDKIDKIFANSNIENVYSSFFESKISESTNFLLNSKNLKYLHIENFDYSFKPANTKEYTVYTLDEKFNVSTQKNISFSDDFIFQKTKKYLVLKKDTPYKKLNSVTHSSTKIKLKIDEKHKFKYEISPTDASIKNVVLKSSNNRIFSINKDGVITPKSSGNAKLIVSANGLDHKSEIEVEIDQNLKNFNLGESVVANFSDSEKIIKISGKGKIDKLKWIELARFFGGNAYFTSNGWHNTDSISINFIGRDIQFPDYTDINQKGFFHNFKGKIKGLENIDTSNVKSMSNMFFLTNYSDLNISNWNTSNVNDMSGMFLECKNLNFDVSKWNTGNVNNMSFMFSDVKNYNPDVSKWNTSNVKEMSYMFYDTNSADPKVDNWNTEKLESAIGMFNKSKLAKPNVSNWNTENIKDFRSFFEDSAVENLDISTFNYKNGTYFTGMLDMLKNLKSLHVKGLDYEFKAAPKKKYIVHTLDENFNTTTSSKTISSADMYKFKKENRYIVLEDTANYKKLLSITPSRAEINLNISDKHDFKYTLNPSDASIKAVKFTSSDNNIFTVNSKGQIIAKSNGNAKLILKASGMKDEIEINVNVGEKKKEEPNKPSDEKKPADTANPSKPSGSPAVSPAPSKPATKQIKKDDKSKLKETAKDIKAISIDNLDKSLFTEPSKNQRNKVINSFIDLKNHWSKNSVSYVVSKKLFLGVKPNEFAADSEVTRAMVVTVIERIAGQNYDAKETAFKDVPVNKWYSKAVYFASTMGIVKGVSKTSFAPMREVSREELATMLYRFAKTLKIEIDSKNTKAFIDEKIISLYAKEAVKAMKSAGIITGRPDGSFDPKQGASRGEFATMIVRFLNLIAKKIK